MAKYVISLPYTFNPSTQKITIGGSIRREDLVLITNVTTNTVLYNFADSALTASAYTVSSVGNDESTTIVLSYATGAMSSTDKLMILADRSVEEFGPSEELMDPVGKMRVSTPQSLIDTDFEYGTQPTKWETISLLSNRPSAFFDQTAPNLTVTAITANGTRVITVSLTNTAGITTSSPVYIQDTINDLANGWVLPLAVTLNTSFTYQVRSNIAAGALFDTTKTYVYPGTFYTGAAIPTATNAFTFVGTEVTVTTTNAHALGVGDAIFVVGTTASTNAPNGAWFVRRVLTSNTFIFDVITAPTGTITGILNGSLYARTWGNSVHRAFDGGVTFSAGLPYQGNQLIRQTRRYFRYQSGKGVQFSTGSNLCSPFQVESLTASGTTITVLCRFPHNVGVGATIKVFGADQSAYNGEFTIASIPTDDTFTYIATGVPAASPATGDNIVVQPYRWYGANLRIGMFDAQNGFFFEYDGLDLYAVRRSSTQQLNGHITALTAGTVVATGFNTRWSEQLTTGDFIVIRGMSYLVQSIISNTSIVIHPEYRGTTIAAPSQCIVSKIGKHAAVHEAMLLLDRITDG
jgi:hypothetical protein